jgi:hypothetical protein
MLAQATGNLLEPLEVLGQHYRSESSPIAVRTDGVYVCWISDSLLVAARHDSTAGVRILDTLVLDIPSPLAISVFNGDIAVRFSRAIQLVHIDAALGLVADTMIEATGPFAELKFSGVEIFDGGLVVTSSPDDGSQRAGHVDYLPAADHRPRPPVTLAAWGSGFGDVYVVDNRIYAKQSFIDGSSLLIWEIQPAGQLPIGIGEWSAAYASINDLDGGAGFIAVISNFGGEYALETATVESGSMPVVQSTTRFDRTYELGSVTASDRSVVLYGYRLHPYLLGNPELLAYAVLPDGGHIATDTLSLGINRRRAAWNANTQQVIDLGNDGSVFLAGSSGVYRLMSRGNGTLEQVDQVSSAEGVYSIAAIDSVVFLAREASLETGVVTSSGAYRPIDRVQLRADLVDTYDSANVFVVDTSLTWVRRGTGNELEIIDSLDIQKGTTIRSIAYNGAYLALACYERGVILIRADDEGFGDVRFIDGFAASVAWYGDRLCVGSDTGRLTVYQVGASYLDRTQQWNAGHRYPVVGIATTDSNVYAASSAFIYDFAITGADTLAPLSTAFVARTPIQSFAVGNGRFGLIPFLGGMTGGSVAAGAIPEELYEFREIRYGSSIAVSGEYFLTAESSSGSRILGKRISSVPDRSTPDRSSRPQITVFPSPSTSSFVSIEYSGDHAIESISIVDMKGESFTPPYRLVDGSGHMACMETSGLPRGMYVIRVKTSQGEFHTAQCAVR